MPRKLKRPTEPPAALGTALLAIDWNNGLAQSKLPKLSAWSPPFGFMPSAPVHALWKRNRDAASEMVRSMKSLTASPGPWRRPTDPAH